jgi:hypothetical protein
MTSSLNLYVTSNGVDHGPLSIEEATKRVGSGEFKPDDLSWHEGVSGWVPLKQLPEWSQINQPTLPPLTSKNIPEKAKLEKKPSLQTAQVSSVSGKPKLKGGKKFAHQSTPFAEQPVAKTGMGLIGKLMVTLAILVFLSTLSVVGFLIYKNIDKFIPPSIEATPQTEPEAEEPQQEQEEEKEEEDNILDQPDPFAPPA